MNTINRVLFILSCCLIGIASAGLLSGAATAIDRSPGGLAVVSFILGSPIVAHLISGGYSWAGPHAHPRRYAVLGLAAASIATFAWVLLLVAIIAMGLARGEYSSGLLSWGMTLAGLLIPLSSAMGLTIFVRSLVDEVKTSQLQSDAADGA